jgi:hypothetical protein
MMPISLAFAQKCNTCLRVGGLSAGADKEVEDFQRRSKTVFFDISEIPSVI